MATIVDKPDPQATYDHDRRMYTATFAYHVSTNPAGLGGTAAVTDAAVSDTSIAAFANEFTITDTEESAASINMVPVGRLARRISAHDAKTGAPLTEVIVEYEGHYTGTDGVGFVKAQPVFGTEMTEIVQSLDTDGSGNYIGIGPQNEGTNKISPTLIWELTYNVAEGDADWFIDYLGKLIGKTNEASWVPNKASIVRLVYGNAATAGQLLMLAPNIIVNRDFTYTVTVRMEHSNATTYHKYPWRHYLDAPETQTIDSEDVERMVRKWGDEKTSTIYAAAPAAGTPGNPNFGSLKL